MAINFRMCNEKDVKVLSEISRITFTEAFKSQNNPEDFKVYLNEAFSIPTLSKELANIHSHFFFIYLEEELIGYFKLNEYNAQNELQEKEGIELERIYIKSSFQGKKLGSQTLAHCIEIANKKQKQYIWLGVWERNLAAIRFYQKHGFSKFKTHPYYIGSDKQTDWLMRKEL